MLQITKRIFVPLTEIEIKAVHSRGPGGQNVNKVSSAVHLRFNVLSSSLPEHFKEKVLKLNDSRITEDGVINIKAQIYRLYSKNRSEAFKRLQKLLKKATIVPKKRRPTKPSKTSQAKRMDSKTKRGQIKSMRRRITPE